MLQAIRFLLDATRGHRLTPWRSPYLRWRIETYSGQPAEQIDARFFWQFTWRERKNLLRFLRWTGEVQRFAKENSFRNSPEAERHPQ